MPWATHMTTAVRTGGPGMGGISVLVIPTNSPGFSHRRVENSGQKAGGASWVELDDVKVPAENLIGRENEGFKIVMTNFNKERYIMAIGCNRKARTCLSHALVYAHKRHTFGNPLVSHQIIRHKIANIAQGIESHWAWLEQLAYHIQHSEKKFDDPEIAGKIALAKVQGGRLLEMANREAQQVFGGAGYQKGGVGATVEQISRDLRMMVVGRLPHDSVQSSCTDVAQQEAVARRFSKTWLSGKRLRLPERRVGNCEGEYDEAQFRKRVCYDSAEQSRISYSTCRFCCRRQQSHTRRPPSFSSGSRP